MKTTTKIKVIDLARNDVQLRWTICTHNCDTLAKSVPEVLNVNFLIKDPHFMASTRGTYVYLKSIAKFVGLGTKKFLMLLCDVCNMGYHTFCLSVPLDRVPHIKWRCDVHR